jgi:desampylase
MYVSISSVLVDQILALAAADPLHEVCGLLLGTARQVTAILPATNVAEDQTTRFEIDPAVQFAAIRAARAGGEPVIGHYHSHPGGRAIPSACDAAMIGSIGALWIIVAGTELRGWHAQAGQAFTEAALVVCGNACVAP